METLIRFKLLADQLHESEFPVFLEKLIETSNIHQLIISAVFNHFAAKIVQSKPIHLDAMHNITNIIHQIIHSRVRNNPNESGNDIDNDIDEDEEESQETIDSMPAELISNISSFLSFKTFIALQLCNRKLYIGCNSPCALPTWHASSFREPLHISINKCSSITHISLDISSNTIRDRKNIKTHIRQLLDSPFRYFRNIKKLSLGSFSCGLLFNNLISKLLNVEFLELADVSTEVMQPGGYASLDSWDVPPIPNLRALSLQQTSHGPYRCGRTYDKLLQAYGSKLIALHSYDRTFSSAFESLRHLKMKTNCGDALKELVEKTSLLETVSIDMNAPKKKRVIFHRVGGSAKISISFDVWMTSSIVRVFSTQTQLKYFEAHTKIAKMKQLFDAIALGLEQSKKYRHRNMKIQTIVHDNTANGSKMSWCQIIPAMQKVERKFAANMDWMLSCKVIQKHKEISLSDNDRDRLESLKENCLVHYFKDGKSVKVVLSNKENKMNGGYTPSGIYILESGV
eukprot:694208_1